MDAPALSKIRRINFRRDRVISGGYTRRPFIQEITVNFEFVK